MHGRGAAPLALRSTTATTTTTRSIHRALISNSSSSSRRRMAAAATTPTATATPPTPLPPLNPATTTKTNPLPSFLRLIAAVNKGVGAVEREGLIPLTLDHNQTTTTTLGHVRPSFLPTLLQADNPASGGGGALVPISNSSSSSYSQIQLHPRLSTPALRTEAMAKTAQVLRERGVVTGWRNEFYPIFGDGAAWTPAADGPLFQIERAVVPWLGARAFGVHINGYVASQSSESGSSSSSTCCRRPAALWVARRSKDKPTWPGMLDHLAAGGQPAGMGATANAVKEAWEEAGVPKELCEGAGGGGSGSGAGGGLRPVGTVTYRGLSSEGLKPDTLFVYDLELPSEFVPEPQDGEVEAFELWSVERVVEALAEAGGEGAASAAAAKEPLYPAFKPNVAVVMIDFLVRHGFVGPDNGPEYAEVVAKLRQ